MKYTIEVNNVTDENLGLDYTVDAETAEEARQKVFSQLPAGDWYIHDVYAASSDP